MAANLAGTGWSCLVQLALIPLYIRFLGVEGYGVVGTYATLQALFIVLDLGLSQTLGREMARLSAASGNSIRIADTARTLELAYWAVAGLIALIAALLSGLIAHQWLNPVTMERDEVADALLYMALALGLRWPVALYMGGLNGLQRQVLSSSLGAAFNTVQGVGALLVLWLVEPTVKAFFIWQAVVALAYILVLRRALWKCIGPDLRGHPSMQVMRETWRFAAGVSGIALLAVFLTQLDKILLSKLLSLEEFGYYTLATAVATSLYALIAPIYTAFYPRFTELVAQADNISLIDTYHRACQIMAVAVLPPAALLVFMGEDLLLAWTGDAELAQRVWLPVALLSAGNALNGLMNLPYALQLAHAWTRLAFWSNAVAVVVLAPAIYLATLRWGAPGAAAMWLALNAGYVVVVSLLMHRRLLVKEAGRWLFGDVFGILAPVVLLSACLVFVPLPDERLPLAAMLAVFYALIALVALLAARRLRPYLLSELRSRLQRKAT